MGKGYTWDCEKRDDQVSKRERKRENKSSWKNAVMGFGGGGGASGMPRVVVARVGLG